jgi:hypothetical protein
MEIEPETNALCVIEFQIVVQSGECDVVRTSHQRVHDLDVELRPPIGDRPRASPSCRAGTQLKSGD